MSNALILEDSPEWGEIFKELLAETPYKEVEISTNLEEGLAKARKTKFGLYVCDGDFPLSPREIQMYEGAFFKFYEGLTGIVTNPNLVLVTINERNLVRARAMGIDCYSKENSFDELIERLSYVPPAN
jgi:DNA-binding NarL/FixJ family response regulator